ncbi:hypothetical protein ACLOJK_036068 [Asimina triloba]
MPDSQMDSKEDAQIQEYDDRFYEEIEAPKFVDFTAPDRSLPDDGSWFCARIGCDQKHEVLDPDALYKSFLLRVMAARSPNIRLRKALSRQAPSAMDKCPHSAPAKSAKDRIPRLAMMASITQKARDNRVKVSLISKLNSTPSNGKLKKSSIEEKALTTPRHKKRPSNTAPFRSVQKAKVSLAVPKTNAAAKALVFHTPKEEATASFKCQNIPTPDICSEMRKLAIRSPAKSNKSSKDAAHDLNSYLSASSPAKLQLSASNGKHKLSSVARGFKGREVPSKYLNKLGKTSPKKCYGPMQQGADNESSDMKADGKSGNSSMEARSISEGCERSLEDAKSKLGVSNTTKEGKSLPSSMESFSKEESLSKSGKNGAVSDDDGESTSEGGANTTDDESLVSEDSPIIEKSPPDSKAPQGKNKIIPTLSIILEEGENSQIADVVLEENDQTSNVVCETDEPIEIADKENASASDENRDANIGDHYSKSKVGCFQAHENLLKKIDTSKTAHESAAANGAQSGKYKKAKPTNPKPFRLRTDINNPPTLKVIVILKTTRNGTSRSTTLKDPSERGILKEANLERRLRVLALKQTVPSSKFPNGNLQKRQPAQNEQKQMTSGKRKSNSSTQEISLNVLNRRVHEAPILKEEKEKTTKDVQLRSPKPSSLQPQLVRAGRSATSPGQLAMIKEDVARSSSRGKRPITVPREPIFHRIHMPKSCTKTVGKVVS